MRLRLRIPGESARPRLDFETLGGMKRTQANFKKGRKDPKQQRLDPYRNCPERTACINLPALVGQFR
jgi:hypothetical protein